MILATHIMIASAVTKHAAADGPITIFLLGLASHYVSDAVPHWDYLIHSLPPKGDPNPARPSKKEVFLDYFKIALDGLAGLSLMFWIVSPKDLRGVIFALLAAAGSVLPDFLQFLCRILKIDFLKPLQDFHDKIHNEIKLNNHPLIGVPLQIIILAVAAYFAR